MSGGKRYVLDANVFIEAHQKYYAFDICPGFWRALVRQHELRRVFSIDRVKDELTGSTDRLSDWANRDVPESFFKRTSDQAVINTYSKMANWVQNERQFTADAKAEFSRVADGWVVAYATANGLTVVTHEVYAPEVRKKVPIPNLCLEFQVEYCNTFGLLRDVKEQFVLRNRQVRK